MPSSSSTASSSSYEYDVFLSFRGEDTRKTFTSHLYAALREKQIITFIDDEGLKQGDEISPGLLNAIEGSKISIIVFSKNYASSKWCLYELVKILDCHKRFGQIVVPVFYHVDPSHVRKQEGTFRYVFVEHEENFKEMPEKVQNWRAALTKVGELVGRHFENFRSEAELIDKIVKDVLEKLKKVTVSTNSNGLVGLNSRIEQIKSLLCMELLHTIQIVGIWGMGGIGKTTLATAIFKQFSKKFDGSCFVENVRSKIEKGRGLEDLQNKILSTILGEKIEVESHNIPKFIKERVRRMKVFIVLDDVNKVEQLEYLIGGINQFGSGSKIVITTRDKGILEKIDVHDTNIYEVHGLQDHEAFELFCNCAFKENHCPEDLKVHSRRLVKYVKGNPLALKVLGSSLHRKDKTYWEKARENLKEICSYDIYEIYNVLKISINELLPKEKSIFLDIACFFVDEDKDFIIRILEDSLSSGLNVLMDKALVTISSCNKVQMHDLLQEMGRDIVREESIKEPGKRSRLWHYKDVRRVLKNNEGSEKIEGIFLDLSKTKDIHIASGVFTSMPNLRLLKIYKGMSSIYSKLHIDQGLEYLPKELRYLYWFQYPLKTLPFNFNPKNLIELNLCFSYVEQLWKGKKKAFKLKSIELPYSHNFIGMPDLSKTPNLERIILENCRTLACVTSSIQNFNHLSVLSLACCESLRAFPNNIHFVSPVTVDFSFCVNLAEFPHIFGNVIKLVLKMTAIEEVPSSIECLANLKVLHLSMCIRLKRLSTSICKLKSLLELRLDDCRNLESFPEISEKMEHLKYINLERTAITELPSSVENLEGLERLSLGCCLKLHSLPDNIGNLKSLKYINAEHSAISQLTSSILDANGLETLWLSKCTRLVSLPSFSSGLSSLVRLGLGGCALKEIPQDIGFLSSLKELDLSWNYFVSLPTSIKKLSRLERLSFSKCYILRSLPELPLFLRYLDASNCYALRSLPEILPCPEELDTSILERLSMENGARHDWTMDCNFTNCTKLNEEANKKILADSQLRIQQMATALLRLSIYENVRRIPAVGAKIILPGSEIPGWLKNRSSESSITIQLPQHSCGRNLIGFAFSAVFEFEGDSVDPYSPLTASCEFEVKTLSNSVGGKLFDMFVNSPCSDHVVLGFKCISNVELPDGNHRTTVSFKLLAKTFRNNGKVKCWGVCPIFANSNDTNPTTLTLKFVAASKL